MATARDDFGDGKMLRQPSDEKEGSRPTGEAFYPASSEPFQRMQWPCLFLKAS